MSNLIKVDRAGEYRVAPFEAKEYARAERTSRREPDSGKVVLPAGDPLPREGGVRREQSVEDRLAAAEKEGYEKGFEQGHKDGLHLAQKRLEESISNMTRLCEKLAALKGQIYREAEQELVSLAMCTARKVLQAEVRMDPHTVLRTLRSCLEELGDQTRVRILLNPKDLEVVKAHLPQWAEKSKAERYDLAEDPGLGQGGCILETGFGRVNGSLSDQLARIEKDLEQEFSAIHGGDGVASEPLCEQG